MSAKTVLILCVTLFSVAFALPAVKPQKEAMKTAETIYDFFAPSPFLRYGYSAPFGIPAFRTDVIHPAFTAGAGMIFNDFTAADWYGMY